MMLLASKKMITGLVSSAAVLGMFLTPNIGFAQTALGEGVVAVVDGSEITEQELAFAAEDLAQDLGSIPAGERRAFLTGVLIDMKLMANEARRTDLDQSEAYVRRLQYLQERSLRRAYFTKRVEEGVGEAKIRAAYDEFIANYKGEPELHARHILVETKDEALAIIADLEAGADFAELAQEKSIGPSAPNGGDLGFFARGRMVKEFEDAAFLLDVGGISPPVQTQFGWHVIKLDETRVPDAPTFEKMAPQIQQQLTRQEYDNAIVELKAGANIEIADPALAAAYAAEPAGN